MAEERTDGQSFHSAAAIRFPRLPEAWGVLDRLGPGACAPQTEGMSVGGGGGEDREKQAADKKAPQLLPS